MEKRLDVRDMAPRERHPLIFRELDALRQGDALLLVNDHDPRPLYYELMAERPGQFSWEPVEQGPETWSVRITRLGGAGGLETCEWLRAEHRELGPRIDALATLAAGLSPASWAERQEEIAGIIRFLKLQLLPHAHLEEEIIYPAVERSMNAVGAAATMARDHREVAVLVGELEKAAAAAGERPDWGALEEVKRLLYSLHAVLRLHFAKEEELYLPVLERGLSAEEDARIAALLASHSEERG
ncbi:MAG TPA: DUF2249 domain-containing protein [Dehalococcoidia bacterium]|nr:DUF2249 domain-containing protein [Dehalococcoidia bacterium]